MSDHDPGQGATGSNLLAEEMLAYPAVNPQTAILAVDNPEQGYCIVPAEAMRKYAEAVRCSPMESETDAALRDAFPHFQDGAPITAEAIKGIGKEYLEMVMGWAPVPREIKFMDADGGEYALRDEDGWYLDGVVAPNTGLASALLRASRPRESVPAQGATDDWRDDPSADERWNAGLDYGMVQLCAVLGVDPKTVNWDAATETLDGDVCAAIGNVFRVKYGDAFDPSASCSPVENADRDTVEEAIGDINSNEADKFMQWDGSTWRTYYSGFDLTEFSLRLLHKLRSPAESNTERQDG